MSSYANGTISIQQHKNVQSTLNISAPGVHKITFDWGNSSNRIVIDNTNSTHYTLRWAKLELGANATPYLPPDPAIELLKCQRYYQRIPAFLPVRASGVSADFIDFTFPISVPMRISPSANLADLSICNTNYVEQDGFTPSVHIVSDGCICIRAAKTAHGMQDAIARAKSALELSAEL